MNTRLPLSCSLSFSICIALAAGLLALSSSALAQDEPDLPIGLGEQTSPPDEPDLPVGLGGEQTPPAEQTEPTLPEGLGGDEAAATQTDEEQKPRFFDGLREKLNLTGFWEIRGGVRTQRDAHEKQASIGETRLQLGIDKRIAERLTFKLRADFLYDAVRDSHSLNLERGRGFVDLREASVTFTPLDFMDVKIGRQILTWGTGDLLFLNDMFPKDWQAFFIGRDEEYLKAPSDAVKLSLFSDLANWDIVFTPRFDPDRFITGERISYYNPLLFGRAGSNFVQNGDIPNEWGRDHEWATRVTKNIGGWELAAYGYWGRWKSPGGFDLLSMSATFPRLNVYGASVRGQLGGGVANVEAAYYDSRQDRGGVRPFVDNSQIRFLVGYERQLPELMPDLTVGGQYYLEWMMNYDDYRRTNIPFMPLDDELRHVVTGRITKLLLNQNLTLSLFAYYSPSDSDAYLRPKVSYKIDDNWKAEVGGNIFFGAASHTFFNQFADNTNVYLALRYSF